MRSKVEPLETTKGYGMILKNPLSKVSSTWQSKNMQCTSSINLNKRAMKSMIILYDLIICLHGFNTIANHLYLLNDSAKD